MTRVLGGVRVLRVAGTAHRALVEAALLGDAGREQCGLLSGTVDGETATARFATPLPNLSSHTRSFAVDVAAIRDHVAPAGMRRLALYHSHPQGRTEPSFRDLQLPTITGLLAVIVAWRPGAIHASCFTSCRGRPHPVAVEVAHERGEIRHRISAPTA